MTDYPRLTDEQLASIRAYHDRTTHPNWREETHVGQLLAEVDRLTAELAQLRDRVLIGEHAEQVADQPIQHKATDHLPAGALESAVRGADALDAMASTPYGRNLLAHALVQLQRDGYLNDPSRRPACTLAIAEARRDVHELLVGLSAWDADAVRAALTRFETVHRDRVLTEAAELTRGAAETLPDGHRAIPGLLVATSGLLAARTAP